MAKRASKKLTAAGPVPAMLVEAAAWPANSRETWAIERLLPYANNARTHSVAQIGQITAAIAKWGWTTPVLVDEAGNILAGHGRVLAGKRLGLTEVPVMIARGWSDADKRAYILADNKIAENAGWDKELLAIEMTALAAFDGMDISLTGFGQDELEELLSGNETGGGRTDPNAAPAAPVRPVSQRGDLWTLGGHRLLCGDCTVGADVDRVLAGACPHLMVTDPIAAVGLEVRSQIIWVKTRPVISRGHYHWQHEPALYAVKGEDDHWRFEPEHEVLSYMVAEGEAAKWRGGRKQSTVWHIEHVKSDTGHGTQKPVECMKRPIINNSARGDFVYEPFSGSGTTIIAAEMLARRCLAIEINPVYVDVAVKRWQEFTGQLAKLADGGMTMDQARAARLAAA